MGSVMKSNTKYKLLFLLLCIVIISLIYLQLTEKKSLIMTPSTHEQVTFLETKNERLTSKHRVYFCLYDRECDYIQICIKVPRNDGTFWQHPDRIEFFIDDEKRESYSYIAHTTWKGEYVIMLLDHVSEFETIKCVYEGNTCEAFFSD